MIRSSAKWVDAHVLGSRFIHGSKWMTDYGRGGAVFTLIADALAVTLNMVECAVPGRLVIHLAMKPERRAPRLVAQSQGCSEGVVYYPASDRGGPQGFGRLTHLAVETQLPGRAQEAADCPCRHSWCSERCRFRLGGVRPSCTPETNSVQQIDHHERQFTQNVASWHAGLHTVLETRIWQILQLRRAVAVR
jgi:hypothetical protein